MVRKGETIYEENSLVSALSINSIYLFVICSSSFLRLRYQAIDEKSFKRVTELIEEYPSSSIDSIIY